MSATEDNWICPISVDEPSRNFLSDIVSYYNSVLSAADKWETLYVVNHVMFCESDPDCGFEHEAGHYFFSAD